MRFIIFTLLLSLFNQNLFGQLKSDSLNFTRDLAVFRRALEESHPNLYRFTPQSQYDHVFDSIENNISSNTNELDFFKGLSRIASFIREGHSFVSPSETLQNYARSQPLFPLNVEINQNKLVVKSSRSSECDHLKGYEISTINGKKIDDIIGKIASSTGLKSTFSNASLINTLSLYNNFAYAYYFFVDQSKTFEIECKKSGDDKLQKMTFSGSIKNLEDGYYPKLPEETKPPYTFQIDANNQTATLKLKTFAYWFVSHSIKDYLKFFKNCFEEIENKGVKNLIIDVRNNRGGEELIGVQLLTYLVDKEFKLYQYIKINSLDFYFVNALAKSDYLNFSINDYHETDSGYYKKKDELLGSFTPKKKYFFKGNTYILCNNRSRSAASTFLALARTHQIGTIIGQESGGAFEDVDGRKRVSFSLPYSGIKVGFPVWSMKIASFNGDPKRGVIPDQIIKKTSNDILSEKDVELEYTHDLIQKNK